MASDDFYVFSAKTRLNQLDAERARQLATLAEAKSLADYDSAALAVQEIANIDAARQNVVSLTQQYIQSQQPPETPEMTAEEKAALPWQKMTWADGLDVARGSKYGADIDVNDPNVQAGFREIQRRRARGE